MQEMDSHLQVVQACFHNVLFSFHYQFFMLVFFFFRSDIDECTVLNPCHIHAECTNTIGGYKCKCRSGFSGDGLICTGKEQNSCSVR